jgi:superfamily I DNA/RNA helicase
MLPDLGDTPQNPEEPELSRRFVSMTYDAFAKRLLDRFRVALPEDFRPAPDYQVVNNISEGYRRVTGQTVDSMKRTALNLHFVIEINKLPIRADSGVQKRVLEIWKLMLKGDGEAPSYLSFPMISRLAEYLIRVNVRIKKALGATYSHVFLDEFQDTTKVQYDLVRTCFGEQDTILTAVGDDKQRIMVWAGADKEIFRKFEDNFSAGKKHLMMNHRSAPRLVQVQEALASRISGQYSEVRVDKRWNVQDGICEVWLFDDVEQETEEVIRSIRSWIIEEGVQQREICVIVRQLPGSYGKALIDALDGEDGIWARNENEFQDLLAEEMMRIILDFVLLASNNRAPEACLNTLEILNLLRGTTAIVEGLEGSQKHEDDLRKFLGQLREFLVAVENASQLEDEFRKILHYMDLTLVRNVFPQYKRGDYLASLVNQLSKLLWCEYASRGDWEKAVESLWGEYSVPIMTIHKSKGLEYDTVIFLGLEDAAFWNFLNQPEEETCAFFVALSRAQRRVIFTFSKSRDTGRYGKTKPQQRTKIQSLYEILEESGVAETIDFRGGE